MMEQFIYIPVLIFLKFPELIVISNEKEDFQLEVTEMAMLRKAYFKKKREAFQWEDEQFDEDGSDVAEARKGVQMEKEHIRLVMDTGKGQDLQ
ncbi:unnamed protein product [Merluccius merluccius]